MTDKIVMSSYDACSIIEGFDGLDHTESEVIDAIQSLIDSGVCWKLQGFYGRLAIRYIEAGLCHVKGQG